MTAVEMLFNRLGQITDQISGDSRYKLACFSVPKKSNHSYLFTVIEQSSGHQTARWLLYGANTLKLAQNHAGEVTAYRCIQTPEEEMFEQIDLKASAARRLITAIGYTQSRDSIAA